MTVAVFSALQPELDLVVSSLSGVRSGSIADWVCWEGRYDGLDVIVARAGLGKVNTAALSALVWERHDPDLMVFTGVAGCLDPELEVGDVVVADRTIQHDAGVLSPGGLERYQAGHLPFYDPVDELGFSPSPALLETLRSVVSTVILDPVLGRTPHTTFGTIVTGDVFLQDRATRDRLYSELSARAVEMEGAALAQTARRLGVDHVVIRSLSDKAAGEAVESFEKFLPDVAANSARLVLALLGRLQDHDRDLASGA